MSTDAARPPPFYCPDCGRKHRADLSALAGARSAVARVTCSRCGTVMALRIGTDGLPTCEIVEQPSTASSHARATAAEPAHAGTSPGGTMSQSSNFMTLAVAAVVAAAVSFGVGRLSAPEAQAPPSGGGGEMAARVMMLEGRLDRLQAELDERPAPAVDEAPGGLQERMDALRHTLEEGLRANSAKIAAFERAQGALGEDFERLEGRYQQLNGRIEANYVTARSLGKRVEAIEKR